MKRITLVRHATTDANTHGLFVGQVDPPLNEQGLKEAESVGKRLSQHPIDRIISSDLMRAKTTANAIASHHDDVDAVLDPRLREMHLGELDGLPGDVVRTQYPELMRAWFADAGTARMPGPGGESLEIVQARAWPCLAEIIESDHEDHTVVVSHTFTMLSCLCQILGMELNRFRHLFIRPASISIVEVRAQGPVLLRLNDTNHLS